MTARPRLMVALGAWSLLLIPAVARAELPASEAPVEAPRPPARPSAAQLSAWVQALASDEYIERKAATQKLLEAGAAAVEPVARAAESDDLELPARCVGILRRLSEARDPAAKQAATAALRALARSGRESLARAADEALRDPEEFQRANLFGRGRRGPLQVQFPAARVQAPLLVRELSVEDKGRKIYLRYQSGAVREVLVRITESVDGKEQTSEFKAASTTELREKSEQAWELYSGHLRDLLRQPVQIVGGNPAAQQQFGIALGGGRLQMHVNNVTGIREIRAEDNGRQVQINDTSGRDIVVRITETAANGKPQTAEYKGRDLDELKQQHPAEIAALYEKYARLGGIRGVAGRGVQIGAIPLGGQPGEQPPGAPFRPGERAEVPADVARELARLQREVDTARRSAELARRSLDQALRGAVDQAREVSELKRHLWEFNDRVKRLAEQEEIKPQDLQRLADEIEKLAPQPAADPAPEDAPEVPAEKP